MVLGLRRLDVKGLFVLVLFGISFLGSWTTDAQACSCAGVTRRQVRDVLPLSFDGRVIATEVVSSKGFGLVRASVSLVRKIKGDVSDKLDIFARHDDRSGCGVGNRFEIVRATGQILEFGVQPWRVGDFQDAVPFVHMCTLSYSEIDPSPKGTGVNLWLRQ
jgi:hypothetical protein